MGMILGKREDYIVVTFTNSQESGRIRPKSYKDPLEHHQKPKSGQEPEHKLAYWARYAEENPWRKGVNRLYRRGGKSPMALMKALHQTPVIRELALSAEDRKKKFTGAQFLNHITSRKENYEAFQIQARGRRLAGDDACGCCRAGLGLFASCVRFEGLDGAYLVCANCHLGARGKRCDFHPSRSPPPSASAPNSVAPDPSLGPPRFESVLEQPCLPEVRQGTSIETDSPADLCWKFNKGAEALVDEARGFFQKMNSLLETFESGLPSENPSPDPGKGLLSKKCQVLHSLIHRLSSIDAGLEFARRLE